MAAPLWVVGVDFSPGSDQALRFAFARAREAGARLILAQACPLPDEAIPPGVIGSARTQLLVLEGYLARRARRVRAGLDRLVQLAKRHGLAAEAALVEGRPAEALAALARERGAAEIVVGTHGHSRLARTILGSTAQRLLLIAPCPVLVVPPDAAAGRVRSRAGAATSQA
jgi:nucleotide-binding universal stress UspA family protein